MKQILYFPALLVALASCKNKAETYTVAGKLLNEAVYASGEILPEEYEYLQSRSTERILKIMVSEGDTVKKGDVLVLLGTPGDNTQLELLSEQLTLARKNAGGQSSTLAELQNRIKLARQKQEQDALNAKRYTELAKEKAVSQKDADDAAVQAASSLTEYNNLQEEYKTRRDELSGGVLQATQQLEQFRQVREGRVLTSRINGRVFSIDRKEGEPVNPGQPILLTGTPGRFKLELLVDERDISKVRTGQRVIFETDAFAGRQFSGTVSKIIPVLQKETRSFKVEVEVPDNAGFFPQSSVEANIVIRDSTEVLAIPADYLLPGDSVFVQQGGDPRKTGIGTGIRNGEWVEVKRGLKKGDIIVKK